MDALLVRVRDEVEVVAQDGGDLVAIAEANALSVAAGTRLRNAAATASTLLIAVRTALREIEAEADLERERMAGL